MQLQAQGVLETTKSPKWLRVTPPKGSQVTSVMIPASLAEGVALGRPATITVDLG